MLQYVPAVPRVCQDICENLLPRLREEQGPETAESRSEPYGQVIDRSEFQIRVQKESDALKETAMFNLFTEHLVESGEVKNTFPVHLYIIVLTY